MELEDRIGIVGAGRMGVGIAIDFAMAGFSVWLETRDEEAAARRCDVAVQELLLPGVLESSGRDEVRSRIRIAGAGQCRDSLSLAIECVPEDEAVKCEVLTSLKKRYPQAVLATNTSSLSVNGLAEMVGAVDHMVGLHFLNPPYMFRIVEFFPGRCSSGVRDVVIGIVEGAGKVPIICRREVPGFVWNRLQFALLREALELVETGVATPSDIDRAVAEGLAPRWVTAGPLATVALGGSATFMAASSIVLPTLGKQDSLAGIDGVVAELTPEASPSRALSDRVRKLSRLAHIVPGIGVYGRVVRAGGQFREVDHVGVAVRSIESAVPWYVEHLEFDLIQTEELPAISVRLAYLDAGNVRLQLVEPTGPGKVADFIEAFGEGLHHVCWTVDSIGDALRGARVDENAQIFQGGLGHRACFLEEQPNGVRIEVIERQTMEVKEAKD